MEVHIIDFDPKYAAAFKQLNLEWLDKYNLTEPADIAMLENYQEEILDNGGVIFLAQVNNKIVGTAALINEGNGIMELAKMAVTKPYRGKGISKLLIEKCLERARELGTRKIVLVSNSKLATALSLYEQYGFVHVQPVESHYSNADVRMEKLL
jgi:putative acetyltransferase